MPLPHGRPGQECQAMPQTAAAEHTDHHGAQLANGRRCVVSSSCLQAGPGRGPGGLVGRPAPEGATLNVDRIFNVEIFQKPIF